MNNWFAEDWLMRLSPDDDREPLPGQSMRTVQNENGIYFTGHYVLLRYLLGMSDLSTDAALFQGAASRLQNRTYPGIFYRHPGNTQRDEAHDNYVALAGVSALMGLDFKRAIFVHGRAWRWCYNTLDPEGFSWRHVRQPGEIAYYYMCCGIRAPFWAFPLLLAGLLVNAYQPRDSKHNNPSTSLLAFFRISVINEMIGWQPRIYQKLFATVKRKWFAKIKQKYGSIASVYAAYFTHPDNPLRALAAEYAGKAHL